MQTSRVFGENLANYNRHTHRLHINEGGTRSTKTYSILQLLLVIALHDKKPTLTSVVSETFPHLRRGAIRDFQKILKTDGLWSEAQWSASTNTYTLPNGSQIEFFSADSPDKVHGPARDRLFINECQNINYDTYRQLAIRTSGDVWLDFNPTHEFWVHTELKDRGREFYVHSTYRDNPFLTRAQIEEIESNKTDENWWRVYGLGEVGHLEGLVYSFSLCDAIPTEQKGREVYGLDFGFTNDPTALVYAKIIGKDIYIREVIYRTGMLNNELGALMYSEGVPKRGTEVYADCAEPKSIEELYRMGYNIKPCIKGEISAQIDILKQYRLHITKDSLNLIKEARNYTWKVDKNGKAVNVPIDAFNHALDALRYAVVTPLWRPQSKGARVRLGSTY